MKFDFHIHSVFSDGSSSVEEIFDIAAAKGLVALAVTDHDTVLGLETVKRESGRHKIPFIPAVEFTAAEKELKFHVLAYNIDSGSPELIKYSQNLLEYLNGRSAAQIRLMQKNGIEIEKEEFFKEGRGGPLYRAKLLNVLAKYGYLKKEEIMDSLALYFGKAAPYYLKDEYKYKDFHQICRLIKRNKGIPILAHPGKIKKRDEHLYHELINSGLLDGIEVYHPANSPGVQDELKAYCAAKNLIATGGSDYHGDYNKLKTPICGIDIPAEVYESMCRFLAKL